MYDQFHHLVPKKTFLIHIIISFHAMCLVVEQQFKRFPNKSIEVFSLFGKQCCEELPFVILIEVEQLDDSR
uniref:Uncharacterized protein n=1 Tax=Rhizophora mucronata TaxID=61149 RepID=A0A2P2NLD6_RHIMU